MRRAILLICVGSVTVAWGAGPASMTAAVTFNKDVAPILNRICVNCHRAGEIGPMPRSWNPDPTMDVKWGDQTCEEMMIGWMDYSVKSQRVNKFSAD